MLSLAPEVSSGVIFVSPSKSCIPVKLNQFVPSYPSNCVKSVLYLIIPAPKVVSLWAVVPLGIAKAPVPIMFTDSPPGANVSVELVVIVDSLTLIPSILIPPVPAALKSKSLFESVVVI